MAGPRGRKAVAAGEACVPADSAVVDGAEADLAAADGAVAVGFDVNRHRKSSAQSLSNASEERE